MRRFLIITCLILSSRFVEAQVKFLAGIDSNFVENKYLNDSTDIMVFLNDPRLNEEFNPLEPDIDLLSAGLYCAIQMERKNRGRLILELSKQQYSICVRFLEFYLPNKFIHTESNIEKFNKTAKKALKKIKFPKGISKVITFKIRALDFKGNNFYYMSKDASTELKLFKGFKPSITDSIQLNELKRTPVPTFTYKKFIYHFIRNFLRKKYNSILLSKDYSSIGCAIKVDKRTLNCNRIPEVALILMFGADRLKNIDKAIIKSKRQRKLI